MADIYGRYTEYLKTTGAKIGFQEWLHANLETTTKALGRLSLVVDAMTDANTIARGSAAWHANEYAKDALKGVGVTSEDVFG